MILGRRPFGEGVVRRPSRRRREGVHGPRAAAGIAPISNRGDVIQKFE